MTPLVYLLAAGNGTRAGGPKAWRPWEGKGLLERQMEFLLGRFEPERIAISIQQAWLKRCRELNAGVRWTPVAPEETPLGAFLGLLKVSPLSDWGFIYHVDMPVWKPSLFDALEQALAGAQTRQALAVVPTFSGRKGHPVALSPRAGESLRGLDSARDRLDWWLRDAGRVDTVEVDDPCIHENLNQ